VSSTVDSKVHIPVVIFLDNGTETSFLVKKLCPPKVGNELLEIHGIGGPMSNPLRINSPVYAVRLRKVNGEWDEVYLNGIEHISGPFTRSEWKNDNPSKSNGALKFTKEVREIMLGQRHMWRYIRSSTEITPGLFRINTDFGPIVGGESELSSYKHYNALVSINKEKGERMPSIHTIEEFWNLESLSIQDNSKNNDDEEAMKQFNPKLMISTSAILRSK
jgi:hypothetical protein